MRLHLPGAFYYVVQGELALHGAEDVEAFVSHLGAALMRSRLRALAFCILEDRAHYLLRSGSKPVGLLVRSVECRRARDRRGKCRSRRASARHRIVVVEPRYLSALVRYLHWLPVTEGEATTPNGYTWSSHAAHAGRVNLPWMDTLTAWHSWPVDVSTVRKILRRGVLPPLPEHVELIERGSPLDARIIGDADFIRALPVSLPPAARRTPLAELCAVVAAGFGVSCGELRSHSRRHVLVVARVLLVDRATRESHTLRAVSRYLERSEVDLSVMRRRYHDKIPELFALDELPQDGSLSELSKRATPAAR